VAESTLAGMQCLCVNPAATASREFFSVLWDLSAALAASLVLWVQAWVRYLLPEIFGPKSPYPLDLSLYFSLDSLNRQSLPESCDPLHQQVDYQAFLLLSSCQWGYSLSQWRLASCS
jgi:hypothetical protein